jgi:hypothetical protein
MTNVRLVGGVSRIDYPPVPFDFSRNRFARDGLCVGAFERRFSADFVAGSYRLARFQGRRTIMRFLKWLFITFVFSGRNFRRWGFLSGEGSR